MPTENVSPVAPSQGQTTKPSNLGRMPYIMPDGRPLSALLHENNLLLSHRDRHRNKKHGGSKAPKHGWTTGTTAAPARASGQMSEAEKAEYAALQKVGQRRQRRFLNEKLLRDMSGVLTAKDMEALFKPIPFGESGHVSAFTMAAAPEHAPLWDLFRSVDPDRQERVLKKWADYVKELRQEALGDADGEDHHHVETDAATAALCSWAAVGSKARKALQKAPRACVEDIEKPILDFLEQEPQAGDQIELELNDSFHRLLGHALADFHSLHSFTRLNADGTKSLIARQQQGRATTASSESLLITCSDVLGLLEEGQGQAISAAALRHAFHLGGGTETSSVTDYVVVPHDIGSSSSPQAVAVTV